MSVTRQIFLAIGVGAAFLGGAARLDGAEPAGEVRQAAAELDRQLGRGDNARLWREYLGWSDLQAALADPQRADYRVLGRVLQRLSSGEPGLESAPFVSLRRALERWAVYRLPAEAQWADVVRQARGEFRVVEPGRWRDSQARLRRAVQTLDRSLTRGGANGAAWRRFLGWETLEAQLAAADPAAASLEELVELNRRFTSGYRGLETPPFARVERGLERLLREARVLRDPKASERYGTLVDALAQRLERWRANPTGTASELRDIGRVLGWLDDHGQAPELVPVLRTRLSQPNLYARVSREIVASGMRREVDRTTRVVDCILGTAIRGTGHTVGTVEVQLVPNPRQAAFDAVFRGVTHSRTLGSNRSARIHTRGRTEMVAHKRMVFDPGVGLTALPTRTRARTRTTITGIGSTAPGLRGRLVTRIARRKAGQSQGQAEAIGSRHAEALFSSNFDAEARPTVDQANDTYFGRLRRPMFERRQFPERLEFTTTAERIAVLALQANRHQLAAQSLPPELSGDPSLAFQAHESAINNTLFGLFAGETLTQERMEELSVELLGRVPEQLKSDSDQEAWSITFDAIEPVGVRFADDGVRIIVKGTRYTSGDGKFGAMNVEAHYQFAEAPEGLVLRRTADLEILPPGFKPGEQKLALRQTTLRNLLKRRFGKLFQTEIKLDGFGLPEAFRQAGTFYSTQHASRDGWLLLAWRNDPTQLPPLTSPAAPAAAQEVEPKTTADPAGQPTAEPDGEHEPDADAEPAAEPAADSAEAVPSE